MQTYMLIVFWGLFWVYGLTIPTSSWLYQENFGLSEAQIQYLRASFLAIGAIINLPVGLAADWVGRVLILRVGFASLFGAGLIYSYSSAPVAAVTAEVLMAIGHAAAFASIPALLKGCATEDRSFSKLWGLAIVMECVVWSGTNLAGGIVAENFGNKMPWIISALLYGISFLLSLFFRFNLEHPVPTAESEPNPTYAELRQSIGSRILYIVALYGLMSASYKMLMYLEPQFLKNVGVSKSATGIITALVYVPVALVSMFGGRFETKFKKVPTSALALAQAMAFALQFIFYGPLVWTFSLLHTVVRGVTRLKYYVEASELANKRYRSAINSMLQFADRAFSALATVLAGFLISMTGVKTTLGIASAVLVLVAVLIALKEIKDRRFRG
jgi:predicted MFS family arabinose efflux permease